MKGVTMRADTFVTNTWYVAGFSSEFPKGKLTGQTIACRPVVMWRDESGKVVAFDGRCVHKRMPLKDGKLLPDGTLECAYHGFCYASTGQCTRIPSQPEGAIPSKAKLKPFPVIEQDGLVWLWPGDASRAGSTTPPRSIEIGSDTWSSAAGDPMQVPANYRLLIENLLDITHFYPLHDGNVGDIESSKIPVEITQPVVDGNRGVMTHREVKSYKQPEFLANWFGYEIVDRVHTHALLSPGLTRVEMIAAPPGQLGTAADRGYVLYHTHTPIDATSHVWRWCINTRQEHRSPRDPSLSVAQDMAVNFPQVAAQDLWALERQQEMFALPDDGYEEVNVRADRAMLLARKMLAAMEAEEKESRISITQVTS
jgi:phenylpropionate dioxygenase-like ring-hydroxylating dioxygenase large terminal subunit